MDKPQIFIDIDISEIAERAADYCQRGWRFANLCGSTVEGGVELLYSFSDGLALENLRFVTDLSTPIASVSCCFPNAFIFENETHELFGVPISDITVDFKGAFYTVSVPTPMNPGAAVTERDQTGEPSAVPTTHPTTDNSPEPTTHPTDGEV